MLTSPKVGRSWVILALAVAGSISCSSSSGAGPAGQGGAGAGAGGATAGQSGASGAAGTSGSCAIPACVVALVDLIQSCQPSGTCVFQVGITSTAFCYGNGTKTFLTASATLTTVRQTFPNGTDCVTETLTTAPDGGVDTATSYVWQDGTGATIATGTKNAQGHTIYTCGGQTYDSSACSSDAGSVGGGSGASPCTPGTCS
jgi:hypothetical protein